MTGSNINECSCVNIRKVVMIGCGYVGSATSFALMMSGMFSEMVFIDANEERAKGEAMDISHGVPFAGSMKIYAGNYDDITDAAIIIITAGANQKPDETRLDLVYKNAEIYKQIIPEIKKRNYKGILLVVSNPVDIMTHLTLKLSGFEENRVIGSGTVLDTARLKYILSEQLGVDGRSIHAFIVGEHGDSEVAAWSCANISGVPINDFCEMRGFYNHEKNEKMIYENVKNSAYEIIQKKNATYFGVAMAVKRICEAILKDEKTILPVTTMLHGEYGIDGTMLSVPSIIGAKGVEKVISLSLDEEEMKRFHESANTLNGIFQKIL